MMKLMSKLYLLNLNLQELVPFTESQQIQSSRVLKQMQRESNLLYSQTKPQPYIRNMLFRLPYFISISQFLWIAYVDMTWQYRSKNLLSIFLGVWRDYSSESLSLSLAQLYLVSQDQLMMDSICCWEGEERSLMICCTLSLLLEWFIISKMGISVYSLVYPKERLFIKWQLQMYSSLKSFREVQELLVMRKRRSFCCCERNQKSPFVKMFR